MGQHLELKTLGEFTIRLDGAIVKGLASRKADALLVYLAVTRRPHAREHLGTLLWDDRPLDRSLANLSVVLNSLKKQLAPFLVIDRQSVAFDDNAHSSVDIHNLRIGLEEWIPLLAVGRGSQGEAIKGLLPILSTYQGDFLQGFHIREARGFEEWMLVEKERLQHEVIEAYEALIEIYMASADYASGIPQARRLLAIDPLRDGIHLSLMVMLVRTGQRLDALQHYRYLQDLLQRELGIDPDPRVTSLYERILISNRTLRHNLSLETGILFGRESDLIAIHRELQDPRCRLLTILAPGGMGKTSLAIQVARESVETYINGAFVVQLAQAGSAEYLVQYIANALGLKFQGDEKPVDQLANYLREKELLLVLDSFEHLLGGVALLSNLLREAPYLTILVTSRERLKMNEEWVYPLEGLTFPQELPQKNESIEMILQKSSKLGALELFTFAAQKVKPGYQLSRKELPDVIRICELVEGMPLGIELGATWLRVLPVGEIARQIESDVDFLVSTAEGTPNEPQRLQAIFNRSWNLLSKEEQRIFQKLAVFRGGFTLEASKQVAGSTIAVLASLVDKSLLRFLDQRPGGESARYEMHELLRQYGIFRLRESQHVMVEVNRTHCGYFSGFLHRMESELFHTGQAEASKAVEDELGNIQVAWHWAGEHGLEQEIRVALKGLFRFYLLRGWFSQGAQEFEAAINHLEHMTDFEGTSPADLETTLAKLLARRGVFRSYLSLHEKAEDDLLNSLEVHRQFGDLAEMAFTLKWLGTNARMATLYKQASEYLNECLVILEQIDDPPTQADALNELGAIALRQSRYDEADEYLRVSYQLRDDLEDEQGKARILINRGLVALRRGDYQGAKSLTSESLEIARSVEDQWGIAASLNNIGLAEEQLKNYQVAHELYQQSQDVKRAIGHRKGVAYSWLNLAMIAYHTGRFQEAVETNLKAQKRLEEIGDRWGLASMRQQLGQALTALGSFDRARENFHESLAIADQIGTAMYIEKAIVGMGELLMAEGEFSRAFQISCAICSLPAGDPDAVERAVKLKIALEEKLSAEKLDAIMQETDEHSVESLVQGILGS